MTKIDTFEAMDWAKHVTYNTESMTVTLSSELADEVEGFAKWHSMPREQVIYECFIQWMKNH